MPRKQLTDAEKIAILLDALHRADRILMEIDAVAEINSIARGIGNRKCSDWTQSITRRARKILQSALKRVCGTRVVQAAGASTCTEVVAGSCRSADGAADAKRRSGKLESVRIDVASMKANGTLKEAKRK